MKPELKESNKRAFLISVLFMSRWLDEQKKLAGVSSDSPV